MEVFRYADAEVRALPEGDDVWFVAADVCAVLEHSNHRMAVAGLDDDEKGVRIADTPGGPQQVTVVSEAGLYSLIFRSRKPEAKAFSRWVRHEVLPAIRRTGRYAAAPKTYAEALRELAASVEAREAAEARARELEAPAAAWTRLASTEGDYSVDQAAKILSRDPGINTGQRRLFEALRELKWIFRDTRYGSKGSWAAYQAAIDSGRLVHRAMQHNDSRTGAVVLDAPQVRVTIKVLTDLHRHLGGIAPIAQALGHEDGAA